MTDWNMASVPSWIILDPSFSTAARSERLIVLSRTGEYALQAMVYLAQHKDQWPIPAPKIAKDTRISQKYLSTILGSLVRNRLLEASPGRGGGFRLNRPAERIKLIEVLAPFEAVLADRRPCPFGNPVCSDDDPCAGHHRWKSVREAYYRFVNQTSVLDVAVHDGKRGVRKKATTRPTLGRELRRG